MTDTDSATAGTKKSGVGSMLLPELKQLASSLGISGASGMRKSDLVAAISEKQTQSRPPREAKPRAPRVEASDKTADAPADKPAEATDRGNRNQEASPRAGHQN